jgi:3-phosphoshikimate 1-carboxyvinyltransferase
MRHFGADAKRNERTIIVKPKPYQPAGFTVSSDWSAASYGYEMAALSEECEIRLLSLSLSEGRPYLQGDVIIAEWMKSLGVNTIEDGDSLILRKMPVEKRPLSFDFSAHPDLFPTMTATCAGLQFEAHFSGVANLSLKESNRVEAMQSELEKIGAKLEYLSENELVLIPSSQLPFFEKKHPLRFESHGDHRIVMALAPLAEKIGSLAFERPEVVEKSYPKFWSEASFLLL